MELQGEDLELFNKLRDKYKGSQGSMPADPNAPGAEVWQPPVHVGAPVPSGDVTKGGNVDVRMCAVCQGAGVCVELYGHRRLEKFCTTCSGRGVTVYKNGVEVVEGESADTQPIADNAPAQAAGQHPISSCMQDEEAEGLRREIQALGEKEQSYCKEHLAAVSALEQCEDLTERQLRETLVSQLAAQLKRLRAVKARKEAQLTLAGRL